MTESQDWNMAFLRPWPVYQNFEDSCQILLKSPGRPGDLLSLESKVVVEKACGHEPYRYLRNVV
jgi:hypothetical protein